MAELLTVKINERAALREELRAVTRRYEERKASYSGGRLTREQRDELSRLNTQRKVLLRRVKSKTRVVKRIESRREGREAARERVIQKKEDLAAGLVAVADVEDMQRIAEAEGRLMATGSRDTGLQQFYKAQAEQQVKVQTAPAVLSNSPNSSESVPPSSDGLSPSAQEQTTPNVSPSQIRNEYFDALGYRPRDFSPPGNIVDTVIERGVEGISLDRTFGKTTTENQFKRRAGELLIGGGTTLVAAGVSLISPTAGIALFRAETAAVRQTPLILETTVAPSLVAEPQKTIDIASSVVVTGAGGVLGGLAAEGLLGGFSAVERAFFRSGLSLDDFKFSSSMLSNRSAALRGSSKRRISKAQLRKNSFGATSDPRISKTMDEIKFKTGRAGEDTQSFKILDSERVQFTETRRSPKTGIGRTQATRQVTANLEEKTFIESRAVEFLRPGSPSTIGNPNARPPSQVKNPELLSSKDLSFGADNKLILKLQDKNYFQSFSKNKAFTPEQPFKNNPLIVGEESSLLPKPEPSKPPTPTKNTRGGLRRLSVREQRFYTYREQLAANRVQQLVNEAQALNQKALPPISSIEPLSDVRRAAILSFQPPSVNNPSKLTSIKAINTNIFGIPTVLAPERTTTTTERIIGALRTPTIDGDAINDITPILEPSIIIDSQVSTSTALDVGIDSDVATDTAPILEPLRRPSEQNNTTPLPTPDKPIYEEPPQDPRRPRPPIYDIPPPSPPRIKLNPEPGEPTPPPPFVPSVPKIPNLKNNNIIVPGFDVLVRRRGKFELLSNEPLARGEALRLGFQNVNTTAAATFKLVPNPSGAKKKRRIDFFIPRDYYTNIKDFFIEPSKNRISTFGELREITYKGQAARRLKV